MVDGDCYAFCSTVDAHSTPDKKLFGDVYSAANVDCDVADMICSYLFRWVLSSITVVICLTTLHCGCDYTYLVSFWPLQPTRHEFCPVLPRDDDGHAIRIMFISLLIPPTRDDYALPSFGSSIPLLSAVRTGAVGLIRFGIEDGEILDIGERACTSTTKTNVDGWEEWGENDNDIDHVRLVFESPYAHLTILHLPRSTYVCVNVIHPLPMHIKVASFWGTSLAFEFEIGDVVLLYLMLRQRAAIRIYGELSVLMTRCPDWGDDIDLLDNGYGSSSMPSLQGFCSSSVTNDDASVHTSPTKNTEEFGLPIYESNSQDDDDNNGTHHPAYNGRASDYGQPCFETTNDGTINTHHNLCTSLLTSNVSNNDYDYYTNNSASRAALISEVNDALSNIVTSRHDAHAPEHGELVFNSTTCHKSASYAPTHRNQRLYLDRSLPRSAARNNDNDDTATTSRALVNIRVSNNDYGGYYIIINVSRVGLISNEYDASSNIVRIGTIANNLPIFIVVEWRRECYLNINISTLQYEPDNDDNANPDIMRLLKIDCHSFNNAIRNDTNVNITSLTCGTSYRIEYVGTRYDSRWYVVRSTDACRDNGDISACIESEAIIASDNDTEVDVSGTLFGIDIGTYTSTDAAVNVTNGVYTEGSMPDSTLDGASNDIYASITYNPSMGSMCRNGIPVDIQVLTTQIVLIISSTLIYLVHISGLRGAIRRKMHYNGIINNARGLYDNNNAFRMSTVNRNERGNGSNAPIRCITRLIKRESCGYVCQNFGLIIDTLTSCIKLNCDDTNNDGCKLIVLIVPYEHGENSENHTGMYDLHNNDEYLINAVLSTCDTSLSDSGIKVDQCNTNDNITHAIGTKDSCISGIRTMKRHQENIGSSHTFDTETTHGKMGSRVCHSASRKVLGTIIGLWNKHMRNQLNDRMTKAYRRGVTCTEIVRICLVSYLYPYLLGSPLFERELE